MSQDILNSVSCAQMELPDYLKNSKPVGVLDEYLPGLRTYFSIPSYVQLKVPSKKDTLMSYPDGWTPIYVEAFSLGLRFPLSTFVYSLLRELPASLGQIHPNSWLLITVFQVACKRAGFEPSVPLFKQMYSVVNKPNDLLTFKPKSQNAIITVSPNEVPECRWHNKWILIKGGVGPDIPLLPVCGNSISSLEHISTTGVESMQGRILKGFFPKPVDWRLFMEEGVLVKAGLNRNKAFISSCEPSWEEVFEAAKGMPDPFQLDLHKMCGRRQLLLESTDSLFSPLGDNVEGNVSFLERSSERLPTPFRGKPLLKRPRLESTACASTSQLISERNIHDSEALPMDPPLIDEQTLPLSPVNIPIAASSSNNPIDSRLNYFMPSFELQPAGLTISPGFSSDPKQVLQALRPLVNKQLGESYENIDEVAMHCGSTLQHVREFIVGIFSLARKVNKIEVAMHRYKAENAQLKVQFSEMQEQIANAKKQQMEQKAFIPRLKKERMHFLTCFTEGRPQYEKLETAVERLKHEQTCWANKELIAEKRRDFALKRAREAEEVQLKARSEAEERRRELAQLKDAQMSMIKNAIDGYINGEDFAFQAGIEIANFMTAFVNYASADTPLISEKFEKFKVSHEMDDAWFTAASDREKFNS